MEILTRFSKPPEELLAKVRPMLDAVAKAGDVKKGTIASRVIVPFG